MLPKLKFEGEYLYTSVIDVRVLDLNMGAHLSNDKVLNYLTEVNERFLRSKGLSLNNINDCTLVVSASYIRFRKEVFYPEKLTVKLGIMEITKTRVFFYYSIENSQDQLSHQAVIESALVNNQSGKLEKAEMIKSYLL
ncbi:thioesterase family protein [Thiotrichales bacterium 19S3-7]|nr:thioesterase family protein [Thiotrichales bacterium 19S3-7]MCF6800936.1 thioesterase family protein [Thiotrichales bacterium 19S3-11]